MGPAPSTAPVSAIPGQAGTCWDEWGERRRRPAASLIRARLARICCIGGLSRDWGSWRDGCWRMRIVGGLEALPEAGAEHAVVDGAADLEQQVGPAPGPAARQIGMCERFGFVEKHQINRPCCRLGFQIGKALTARLDRGCVLAPFEGVSRAAEGKPLWRNWCESHRGEIAGPPRRAISAH